MLLAVYEPSEGVAFVVAREHHFVDVVPLGLAVVARRPAKFHLPRRMVDAPIPPTKAHVALHHEMTMQRHHPKPEMAIASYYKFWIRHKFSLFSSVCCDGIATYRTLNHPQSLIKVPNAPRLKVFFTQMGMCFSATGLMVGA